MVKIEDPEMTGESKQKSNEIVRLSVMIEEKIQISIKPNIIGQ